MNIYEQAARDFGVIPEIEQVRYTRRSRHGITFYVIGEEFRGDLLERIINIGLALYDAYPNERPLVEIQEHFGRGWQPYTGTRWRRLTLARPCEEVRR